MTDFYLETERLIIRNWKEQDRDLFHFINSDDTVMQFFPFRRDRLASDKMMDELKSNITKDGYGFSALELKETSECIGFCGLADAHAEDGLETGGVEIGWRLAPQYWGKGYVTEAAQRLIVFGFEELVLDEIISFAVKENQKSFAVMERLGMKHDKANDFDHTRVPDTHPQLKPHLFYCLKNPNKKGRINRPKKI